MRYAVQGATIEQVKNAKGTDIKKSPSTEIIFATLTEEQVAKLKALGCQAPQWGKRRR